MNPRVKNSIYTLVLIVLLWAGWKLRNPSTEPIFLEGKTMGTSYHITYFDERGRNFQSAVDSLMVLVNRSISTYDTTSDISRFNQSAYGWRYQLPYFYPPLKKSQEVVTGSSGAYDPTVMPLVNAWGFGPKKVTRPDTSEVLAARSFVGFEKIGFNEDSVWKNDPRVQLDFSAIGQGYGSDVIGDFLVSKGIRDFFVELGGEGVARGINRKENRSWEIGILDPESDYIERKTIAQATLHDEGYSTSGNYFNFREVDGRKYSHTIDPVSGFPVERPLLCATVFAADCATADAWATAFMSMGHERGIELLKTHPELNVLFVYSTPEGIKTYISPGISGALRVQQPSAK